LGPIDLKKVENHCLSVTFRERENPLKLKAKANDKSYNADPFHFDEELKFLIEIKLEKNIIEILLSKVAGSSIENSHK